MTLEIRRINATSAQGQFKVFATVKPLTARRNFHSLEQQVEAICCPGCPSGGCVERAPRQRKSEHEDGGDTGVPLRQLTQLALGLGVELGEAQPMSCI